MYRDYQRLINRGLFEYACTAYHWGTLIALYLEKHNYVIWHSILKCMKWHVHFAALYLLLPVWRFLIFRKESNLFQSVLHKRGHNKNTQKILR